MKKRGVLKYSKFWIFVVLIVIASWTLVRIYHKAQPHVKLGHIFEENIEYRFYSYATLITGKQRLQVAKLNQTEVFERTSNLKAFWLDLPSVVVKTTVPVEYNFFVDLHHGWKFRLEEDSVIVEVPELTNSRPAVNISELHFDVVKGSIFRNEKQSLEALQKELMTLLIEKSVEHRELVRNEARTSIQNFVREWLSQLSGLRLKNEKIYVLFPGEDQKSLL